MAINTDTMYEAGLHAGNATSEAIAIMKTFKRWADKTKVDEVRLPFCAGYMVGYGQRHKVKIDKDRALLIPGLKPEGKGEGDDVRTAFEQKAWESAKATWSQIAKAAGKPSREGVTRAPKAASDEGSDKSATHAREVGLSLTCSTYAEVATLMAKVANMFVRFSQVNGDLKTGDYGTIMRTYIDEVARVEAEDAARVAAVSKAA